MFSSFGVMGVYFGINLCNEGVVGFYCRFGFVEIGWMFLIMMVMCFKEIFV